MKTGDKVLIINGQYKGRYGTFVDNYAMTRRIQDPDIPHVRIFLEPEGLIIIPKSDTDMHQSLMLPDTLLNAIYELGSQDLPDMTCDLILHYMDDWMLDGRFDLCDELLEKTNMNRLDTIAIVGLLSATICAKERLSQRKRFVEQAESRLEGLAPDRVEKLMEGLR